MMFGKHVRQQLSAYCNDELTIDEKRHVSEHLTECRRCRSDYEQIAIGVQWASRLVPEEAPASIWSEIERKLAEGEPPRQVLTVAPSSRLFSRPQLAIVCGLLVLLLGLGGLLIYLRRPSTDHRTTDIANQGANGNGSAWAASASRRSSAETPTVPSPITAHRQNCGACSALRSRRTGISGSRPPHCRKRRASRTNFAAGLL